MFSPNKVGCGPNECPSHVRPARSRLGCSFQRKHLGCLIFEKVHHSGIHVFPEFVSLQMTVDSFLPPFVVALVAHQSFFSDPTLIVLATFAGALGNGTSTVLFPNRKARSSVLFLKFVQQVHRFVFSCRHDSLPMVVLHQDSHQPVSPVR